MKEKTELTEVGAYRPAVGVLKTSADVANEGEKLFEPDRIEFASVDAAPDLNSPTWVVEDVDAIRVLQAPRFLVLAPYASAW
ncbi:MAG TPA: hypothetical protein VGM82_21135 [Gemmatimonadaceae bacterium]